MTDIIVTRGKYPQLFGGLGFHNNDATMYHVMEREHFHQFICKNYREISPGFMRTFGGFAEWTKEAMDEFAEYYEQMQKWTDTPIYLAPANGKVHFSEAEMRRHCVRVADNLAYLYFEKGVKHIRYYCFSNEMSRGMWGALLKDLPTFKRYHEMLFEEFSLRDLPIGLLATDASGEYWDTLDWAIENMADITEDYCVHTYEDAQDIYDLDFYDIFYNKCKIWVDKAIANFGKRLILGEMNLQKNTGPMGMLRFNGGVVVDTNRYFNDPTDAAYCGLMLSELIFSGINAGVFAMAMWTFCDHPAPYSCAYSSRDGYAKRWGEAEQFFSCTADTKYNQWGFTKWDDYEKDYGARPHYWCIAPIVKYFKRNSYVMDIETNDPLLRCCAVMNRDGSVSLGVVNRHKEPTTVKLQSTLFKKEIRVFEYDPENVPQNRFCDLPEHVALLRADAAEYALKAQSVTIFTTDYIEKEKTVSAKEVSVSGDTLTWKAVTDPQHCYYRVFASTKKAFTPAIDNQIASTVATSLSITDPTLHYKVLSVDRSGNV